MPGSGISNETLHSQRVHAAMDESARIVRSVAGGQPIDIEWRPRAGFAVMFDRRTDKVVKFIGDSDQIQNDPDYAEGAAAHEANHIARSRFKPHEKYIDRLGYGTGNNWAEDSAVEYEPDRVLNGNSKRIKSRLDKDIAAGGIYDISGVVGKAEEQLGWTPPHILEGAFWRRYFYGRVYAGLDPATASFVLDAPEKIDAFVQGIPEGPIRDVFIKVRSHVEEMWQAVPEAYASEEEIVAQAETRAKIFQDSIWPEYQKLVDESVEEQSAADFFKDIMDAIGGEQGDGSGQKTVIIISPKDLQDIFDKLPPDVQKELQDAMKGDGQQSAGDGQKQGQSGGGKQQEKPNNGQSQSGGPGSSSDSSEGAQSLPSSSKAGTSGSGGEDRKTDEQMGDSKEGKRGGKKPRWGDRSDNAKKALKDAFKELPERKKEKYKDQAKEDIGNVEDAMNEELGAHTNSEKVAQKTSVGKKNAQSSQKNGDQDSGEGVDSGSQQEGQEKKGKSPDEAADMEGKDVQAQNQQKSQEQEAEQKKTEEKTRREMEAIERHFHNAEASFQPRNTWAAVRFDQEIDTIIRQLLPQMGVLFKATQDPKKQWDITGEEVDFDRVLERMVDPDVWETMITETQPRKKNYMFDHLADMTGSEKGEKMRQQFRMLVMLVEMETRLGIGNAVSGFTSSFPTTVREYLPYDAKRAQRLHLTEKEQSQLSRMVHVEDGVWMPDGAGSTPISEALGMKYRSIAEQQQRLGQNKFDHYFLLFLTDGEPDEGVEVARQNILAYQRQARALNMNVRLIGLGLGPDAKSINELLPPLPDRLRQRIATRLNNRRSTVGGRGGRLLSKNDITNHFESAADAATVMDIILGHALMFPNEFG